MAVPGVAVLLATAVTACGVNVRPAATAPTRTSTPGPPPPAVLPDLPPGATKAHGLNPEREAGANRALRATLPTVPGAQLLTVSDQWITKDVSEPGFGGNSTDRTVAVGVETTWEYHLDDATKCQVAAALEAPLAAGGWAQDTLETSGPGGVGSIRYSQFAKPGAHLVVSIEAPPTGFAIGVQAHTKTTWSTTPQPPSPFSACHPDLPPSPPDTPVDKAAALAANQSIYLKIPIPHGAALVEKTAEAATAMGNGKLPIGYGTSWHLHLPAGTDLCATAATFEAAMAAARWERFTDQSTAGRDSRFYRPPHSVEATFTPAGDLDVLVMNNGAVVGTRQYPAGNRFHAGGTPESRGQSVPCILD